jgi:hypothetical protein
MQKNGMVEEWNNGKMGTKKENKGRKGLCLHAFAKPIIPIFQPSNIPSFAIIRNQRI